MRVALDCGPLLVPPTGVGRYVDELARALEASGVDLLRFAVAMRGSARKAEGLSIKRLRLPAKVAQTSWRRFGRPALESLVGDVDIVHATNFVLPALGRTPGVVTIHDLSFFRDDTFPGGERLRELVPWSLDRASMVITPTRAVADELVERFGVEDGRIAVTPEGIAPHFFGAGPLSPLALGGMGIPGPFILALGTIEPRKNLPRLLAAWSSIRGELEEWRLVIAGPRGWGEELRATEGVMLLGRVGDETLPGLLAAAEIFCYPSLYEGFGLPPLEAMAAGTCAVVGSYEAAPEVVGQAAALVEPTDTEALAESLRSLAGDADARRRLAMAGRARALSFTWERTARLTAAAYERALGQR
ncbi:MAG: glycosyltransferase family 4 protein [Actinomycetota bacterium]